MDSGQKPEVGRDMNSSGGQVERSADAGSAAAFAVDLASRIWEEKAIGLIYSRYVHTVSRHESSEEVYGREQVIAATIRTLAAFPDLRLFGHEVICSGDQAGGFLVSHRMTRSGHHLGHGDYGPPTGRRINQRLIVQQLIRDGRVLEEWSVQDETALLAQLGLDPLETARHRAQQGAERGSSPLGHALSEVPRLPGQLPPRLPPDAGATGPEGLPGLLYELVWNARMLNRLGDLYTPDAVIQVPGGQRLAGPARLAAYILQLLAAFPDGAIQLDALVWHSDETLANKVAARWTFQGTHRGAGVYGPPTGKRVRVIGISHFELRGGQISREYMIWDELALLEQLVRPVPTPLNLSN